MGNAIYKRLFGKQEVRILFMGLDAAGKTTTLYKLKLGEVVTTIPTIGFNVETVQHKNVSITAWDVGGRDKIRPLWRHYYQHTHGIVFVVDSNDRERIEDAFDEMKDIVEREEELQSLPVLILANKQDLPNAMKPDELGHRIMEANLLRKHTWTVFGVSAVSGDGAGDLYEALSWLTDCMTQKKKEVLYEKLAGSTENTAHKDQADVDPNNNSKTAVSKLTYLADIATTFKKMLVG